MNIFDNIKRNFLNKNIEAKKTWILETDQRETIDFNLEDLKAELIRLQDNLDYFLILTPPYLIDKSNFIQVIIDDEKKLTYHFEISILIKNKNNLYAKYDLSFNQAYDMVKNYYLDNKIPKYEDWDFVGAF